MEPALAVAGKENLLKRSPARSGQAALREFSTAARGHQALATRSLTVLLPVQDAQATLADTVEEVLEIASDWTQRIELLIIDDGSSDATSEVAHELVRHYPQVRALRHSRPLGREAAVRTGLAQSRGDVVVLREPGRPCLQRLRQASKPARPKYLAHPKPAERSEGGPRRGSTPYT